MCILNSGNVGIGTATPTEKLEVNGNAKISGNLTLNDLGVNGGATIQNNLTVRGGCFFDKNVVVYNSTNPSIRDRLLIYDNSAGYLYYNEEGTLGRNVINASSKWFIDRNGNANFNHINKTAWNSGEIMKTTILTEDLINFQSGNPNVYPANLFSDKDPAGNNLSTETICSRLITITNDCTLCIYADIPYYCGGGSTDSWIITVALGFVHIVSKTQTSSSGGGSRSSPLFPLQGVVNNVIGGGQVALSFLLSTTTDEDTIYFKNPNSNVTAPPLNNIPKLFIRIDEIKP
jgi:hypothetical protein